MYLLFSEFMPQIKLDTFEIDDLLDVVLKLLKEKSVETVEFEYFSLAIDDVMQENISIDDLKERFVERYDAEEGYVEFRSKDISCSFDGCEIEITYLEAAQEEINKLK